MIQDVSLAHILIWTYETMNIAHILLSGLLILASFLALDIGLRSILHLTLASSLCLGFGLAHLTGFLGPGMWTSDSLNLVGTQELFGPTRYSWDNAYYSLDIRTSCSNAWNTLPDKLVLYDLLDLLTLLKVAYFVQDQCLKLMVLFKFFQTVHIYL